MDLFSVHSNTLNTVIIMANGYLYCHMLQEGESQCLEQFSGNPNGNDRCE